MLKKEEDVWYFAIGSMMNPVSLKGRNLHPIESNPAELLDYELGFFGAMGMAFAKPGKGKPFHGVLHKMTQKEMLILDKIEFVYTRTKAKAKLYDGTEIDCTVYANPKPTDGRTSYDVNKPPTERYIDIMT